MCRQGVPKAVGCSPSPRAGGKSLSHSSLQFRRALTSGGRACDFWVSLTLWTKCSFGADEVRKIVRGRDFVATSFAERRNEYWGVTRGRPAEIAIFATPTTGARWPCKSDNKSPRIVQAGRPRARSARCTLRTGEGYNECPATVAPRLNWNGRSGNAAPPRLTFPPACFRTVCFKARGALTLCR